MMTLTVRDRDARPQDASPFITRLPAEIRLMIYHFFFMGCQATVWFDDEFDEKRSARRAFDWPGRCRPKIAREGQCCYGHSGGGFSLLMSCRLVYIEAFQAYWEETALRVTGKLNSWRIGCLLRKVCLSLPEEIKANLRHLQNMKLSKLGGQGVLFEGDDSNTVVSLLRHFPKLAICAFIGRPWLANVQEPPYILGVPDSDNFAEIYWGHGPFNLKNAQSPAEYLECYYGVEQSCRVMFFSTFRTIWPRGAPHHSERRFQYFNYATGIVYQTTYHPQNDDGFKKVKKGSSKSYSRDRSRDRHRD